MDLRQILTFVKDLKLWQKIMLVLAAAAAVLALTSCARRSYVVRGSADKVNFEYRDTLYPKTFLR